MLYMPTIANYLKVLIDEEAKDFVVINFGECFFPFCFSVLYITSQVR